MQSHFPEFDLLVPRSSTILLEFVGGLGMDARLSEVSTGKREVVLEHTIHLCTSALRLTKLLRLELSKIVDQLRS